MYPPPDGKGFLDRASPPSRGGGILDSTTFSTTIFLDIFNVGWEHFRLVLLMGPGGGHFRLVFLMGGGHFNKKGKGCVYCFTVFEDFPFLILTL